VFVERNKIAQHYSRLLDRRPDKRSKLLLGTTGPFIFGYKLAMLE
jgi:hypothetical protein